MSVRQTDIPRFCHRTRSIQHRPGPQAMVSE